MPGVSLPTVYATLELLEELGLVRRLASTTGSAVYDPRTDAHHHLVCRRCGRIADVDGDVDDDAVMRAARRAGLRARRRAAGGAGPLRRLPRRRRGSAAA